MSDFLASQAFFLWGSPATWLEVVAAAMAVVMVGCNMREIHWGWPLAVASSLLYAGVFVRARIYGDAALQLVFAVAGLWGWSQWLRGKVSRKDAIRIVTLSTRGRVVTAIACIVAWLTVALFLVRFTDSDVPWIDGFATGLSLVGQFLLARKFIENWWVWLAVNVVSVGLFVHKGLWLTSLLYAVFAALSVAGYFAWRSRSGRPTGS